MLWRTAGLCALLAIAAATALAGNGIAGAGAGAVASVTPRLATELPPSVASHPAAVRVGVVGSSDIAVLDGAGRTLAAARLGVGPGAVPAVCPGTTHVALVSSGEPHGNVMVVDLARLTVVTQREAELPWLQPLWEPIACYDAGGRIVVASSATLGGRLQIVSNTPTATVTYEADPAFGGAALHPAGTAILLPVDSAVGLRTLNVADLTTAGAADVALPAGASIADGAISPDGTRLAMLATLDGTPAVERTPNTHVIVVALDGGLPVPDTATVVPLEPESVALPEAPALKIEWVDDSTWVIEHVGNFSDWLEFVAADGTQLVAPFEVGDGGWLAPVAGGLLRRHLSGVQFVSIDGRTADGDPTPDETVDRMLLLASLNRAAPFVPAADEGSGDAWIGFAAAGGLAAVLISFAVVQRRSRTFAT